MSVSRDTVASVGLIYNRAPPLTHHPGGVRVSRHALSLDEVPIHEQTTLCLSHADFHSAERDSSPASLATECGKIPQIARNPSLPIS